MSYECIFCKKLFTTNSNLKKHQKTTKKCINIQLESISNIETKFFKCEYCKKDFTTKQYFEKHTKICVNKLKDENTLLTAQLSEARERILDLENNMKTVRLEIENEFIKERNNRLETTVEEIAKQPKNQQINNKIIITTPLDLSSRSVQQAIESNFSHEHLTMGQKGVARFAYDNMLKDDKGKLKYICTDPSRQVFQYKNDKGVLEKDVRATKLTKALLEADIKQTSHKIAWDNMKDGDNDIFMQYTNHYQNIQELEQDNSDFSKELSCLAI